MTAHVWRRSTFGTNTICDRCNLLPLDQDDIESDCPPPCEVDDCGDDAYPCECGAAHCPSHPHEQANR